MRDCARLLILSAVCACALAQAQYDEQRAPRYIENEPKPTPVPILKQINRHNEDGSYTYGYEAADGSFKIETKAQNGEVKGKYGYKDDTGKLRVIEYGANRYGFQPSGEGITVAPPTLVDETTNRQEQERPKPQGNRNQYRAPPPPPPRQQQNQDYDYEDSPPAQPQYRPPPQQPQYQPPPPAKPAPAYRAPVAPRPPKPAFFSGAAPAPIEQNNFFRPAPQQQQYRPAPAPKQQDFRQSQQFQPQQQQGPQQFEQQPQVGYSQAVEFSPNAVPTPTRFVNNGFQKSPKSNQGFSMLDQLLKEFALPPGGAAPLHDITFGSY